jgi:hypothetical protein
MRPIGVAYNGIPLMPVIRATHLSPPSLGAVEGFRIRRQFKVGLKVKCLHNLESILSRPA